MKNKLIKDSLLFNWRKDKDLSKLINILYKRQEIRFVGGCVRDALLGNKIVDIDFAINCKPEITKDILTENGFKICVKGIKFGSISTVVNGKKFEITSLRKDIETFGRFAKVEYTDSWEEDSLRRDFTINSLYLSTDGHVFDKHNGIKDIKEQRLLFIGNVEKRIKEDYLRILRFYRFMGIFKNPKYLNSDVKIVENHIDKIKNNLSNNKIKNELIKILDTPYFFNCFKINPGGSFNENILFNNLEKWWLKDNYQLGLNILKQLKKLNL